MSTQDKTSQSEADTAQHPVVLVGVDGSARNRAAVEWAHHEATVLNGHLVLVGASHEYSPPTPRFSIDYADEFLEDETRKILESVRGDLGATEREVSLLIGNGGARSVLLRAAKQADLLVVGRRGLGAVKRMFVGSNSIAVAGRSTVPVVVVPNAWKPSTSATAPVVVGLDVFRHDDAVLAFAFDRAARLHAPLTAVFGWTPPPAYMWSPQDLDKWRSEAIDEATKLLEPWRDRYPSVDVQAIAKEGHAATVVLDAGAAAQMVVVGRHTSQHHVGGFHLGSTTRTVLHYSECPVAIIPCSSREHVLDDDEPEEA